MTDAAIDDPRFVPAIDLLRRTGARSVQVRYSDDELPVVWLVVVEYGVDVDDRPIPSGGAQRFETAAALTPAGAAFRLCDQVINGGTCAHCGRPSGFNESLDPMPLETHICWSGWDPELATFRRACEGETEPKEQG